MLSNVEALFAKDVGDRLDRKVRGEARSGQRTFVKMTASGQAGSQSVTARNARAAATQLFGQFMRGDGRAVARDSWNPLTVPTPEADTKFQLAIQRAEANTDLTCRNTLQRCRDARDALDDGAEEHQHKGTLLMVLREWLATGKETHGISSSRAAHLVEKPHKVRGDELEAGLQHFRKLYLNKFRHPIGDGEDARFQYVPHFVMTVAEDGVAAKAESFLCALERNTAPSAMELVRGIVNRTRIGKLAGEVIGAEEWKDGTTAPEGVAQVQREMLQRKHKRQKKADEAVRARKEGGAPAAVMESAAPAKLPEAST